MPPGLEVVRLRDAGRQRQHALEAPAVDRQVLQLLARRLRLHGGGFGLEQHRVGRHEHRLLQRADAQPGVDADGRVEPHDDVLRAEGLKARQRHVHAIGAGGDVRERVVPGLVARRLARLVRFGVGDRDGGAGHGEIRLIGDGAHDGSVQHLCYHRRGHQHQRHE